MIEMLPDPPEVSNDLLKKCRETEDYREILFEYYRKIAILCAICSHIQFNSPSWSGRSELMWSVLVGLLTRTQRIMAGHLEYFQDDRYGDITYILDRCLLETCVKVRWISLDGSEDRLRRYLEDSLRVDRELYNEICQNVDARAGEELAIETRMLSSIRRNASLAGIDVADFPNLRKAPPLAAMVEAIGERRYVYTVVGKVASHAVHGSWANLLQCYLYETEDGKLRPANEFPPSHINQYVFNCLFVLDACSDFIQHNFHDECETQHILAVLKEYTKEIWELNGEIFGDDFATEQP